MNLIMMKIILKVIKGKIEYNNKNNKKGSNYIENTNYNIEDNFKNNETKQKNFKNIKT